MKKLLLLIFSLITLAGYSQTTLSANPDTFTVIQARVDTFKVTSNDSIPLGDSVCITLLDTMHLSVIGCTSIIYHPDSTFTGRDTCRYVLCDTALICDTSIAIIQVDSDQNLLPIARFGQIFSSPLGGNSLFNCSTGTWGGALYILINTSLNSDSVFWVITNVNPNTSQFGRHKYSIRDTFQFQPQTIFGYSTEFQTFGVCITAFNRFGQNTFCDTTCEVYYEGISEVPLSNIRIYPTPASQTLIIDMSQNTDDISTHYTAIDLYNALGQKVRTISKQNNNKIINIPVATLPDGIYLATISDASHTERMLGKFTIAR
jgi:hypothetical protein